jgi:hypothetical protein
MNIKDFAIPSQSWHMMQHGAFQFGRKMQEKN